MITKMKNKNLKQFTYLHLLALHFLLVLSLGSCENSPTPPSPVPKSLGTCPPVIKSTIGYDCEGPGDDRTCTATWSNPTTTEVSFIVKVFKVTEIGDSLAWDSVVNVPIVKLRHLNTSNKYRFGVGAVCGNGAVSEIVIDDLVRK